MLEQFVPMGLGLPATVALAAVAVIGYLFGRRQKQPLETDRPEEFLKAAEIAHQLEAIASALRNDLAVHHTQVERFQQRIEQTDGEANWRALSDEAEQVLAPTLRLVGQMASAYDQIRQQTKALSHFTGGRTDAVTGLGNLRALHELLEMELGGHLATHGDFSIAVLSVDGETNAPGSEEEERKEQILQASEFLRTQLRDCDIAARYGADELAVVMPHTRLFGASVFGRRLRKTFAEQGGLTLNGGLAQSMPGDTPQTLLARADSALYSAKMASKTTAERDSLEKGPSAIQGTLFLHTGNAILPDGQPTGRQIGAIQDQPLEPCETLRLVPVGAE